MKDPYAVLGIERSASEAEIKKAYRRLARKSHPDVNPGDAGAQKRFQEIAAAYEILKDKERRLRFDRTGDTGEVPDAAYPPNPGVRNSGNPFGGGGPFRSTGTGAGGFKWSGEFGDLFSEIFSGAQNSGQGESLGDEEDDDAAAPLTIPFRDAVLGGTVTFRARIPRRCKRCGGTGHSGRNACPACHGARVVVENEKLSVRIPAGVDTGSKIRIPGKGRSDRGDLYLALTVEPHAYFGRDGDDINAEVPVTIPEAYLGAEIEVPTITGPVRAKIPPGTAAGQRFRLKGRGVPNIRTGTPGDHYYKVTVAMPTLMNDEGRSVAARLAALYEKDPRTELATDL